MDKWRFRKLTNEMNREMRRHFREVKHQLRFGRPNEEERFALFERLELFAPK